MPCLEDTMPLILFAAPQEKKQRTLGSVHWKYSIVPPIDHQDRNRHTRGKIDLINLRQGLLLVKPPNAQHTDFEAILQCHENNTHGCSPTESQIGQFVRVDVWAVL